MSETCQKLVFTYQICCLKNWTYKNWIQKLNRVNRPSAFMGLILPKLLTDEV